MAEFTDLERARAAAVALEQECAALTDTLALLTHEYVPDLGATGWCRDCDWRADDPCHRTPDWLRKRFGLGV